MTTFRQNCPHCQRALELPADAKGRLGQCPACQSTFTIGEEAGDHADSQSESPPAPPSPHPLALPIPESSENLGPWGEITGPPGSTEDTPSTRALEVTSRSIEDVLSTTVAIFTDRWKNCVVPSLILAIGGILFVVPALVTLDLLNQAGATVLAAAGYLLFLPVFFLLSAYTTVGVARVALAIVRNEASPLTRFLAPPIVVARAVGIGMILSLILGVACLVMLTIVGVIRATGARGLGNLLVAIAWFASLALAIGVGWQFWAALFVCADEKGNTIGSIRAAQAISAENKLTSFFIALIALVLSLLGTLTCLVGHIVTAPLTLVMFAVAYLLMTGQAVSDPRDPQAVKPSQQ